MAGNCSWEAHPGNRNKVSATGRGPWSCPDGCRWEGQTQPSISSPIPPFLAPLSSSGPTVGSGLLWAMWPGTSSLDPPTLLSSSVRQAPGLDTLKVPRCADTAVAL
ncbi:MRGPRF isoform 3 [Pongo abelii]|uniref:MRGPRF isoform 3 n=1 Tax=Pongo abelii TaxID=9601 RepID=A0A2J8U0U1_PONAB|nr:MRGPRF isoform 3 [Pongo abelii]